MRSRIRELQSVNSRPPLNPRDHFPPVSAAAVAICALHLLHTIMRGILSASSLQYLRQRALQSHMNWTGRQRAGIRRARPCHACPIWQAGAPLCTTPQNNSQPPPDPEQPDPKERLFGTLPNILTAARLASAPVICGAVLMGAFKPAACMFAVSGLLDWADGWIARRWNLQVCAGGGEQRCAAPTDLAQAISPCIRS